MKSSNIIPHEIKKLTDEERSFREILVKNNFWKIKGGYFWYLDKSNKEKGKYNYPSHKRSRVLMELKLNRILNKDEIVHHINENKMDDKIENLKVMKDNEHKSLHFTGKKKRKKYKKKGKIISKINFIGNRG